MTAFAYDLVTGGAVDTVVAFNPNAEQPIVSANSFHPNFEGIVEGLRNGDPHVWSLFSVQDGIMSRFHQISDRYAWNGESILFDGDPVHNSFTELLTRALEAGDTKAYTAIAKFGDKLASNPDAHSREQAYDWLSCHKFQITDDGDVVGYKGVQYDGDGFKSGRKSEVPGKPSAFVNGLPVPPLSYVPQKLGDVVSMPRSEVSNDPNQTCSRGLHISTRSYAESWGGPNGTVVTVFVNPAHIVSVPNHAGAEKVRVHRYKVSHVASESTENDHGAPVLHANSEGSYTWTGDVGARV